MNFSFGKNKKDKALSARANTNIVSNEEYPLAVVITLLKNKALHTWGLEESTEILNSIASLREFILLGALEPSRENSNAIFKLGQTATIFNLLCEKHGLKSPLEGLKGHEVTAEVYQLAKLDKAFYGNKDAFVATEELIRKKQYSDPSDSNDGFASVRTQYKFANIKLYDTVILLKVLASTTGGEFGSQITRLLNELEELVSKRKSLDVKKEQCIEFISKGKDTEQNLRILKNVTSEIEDLGRKLGSLETDLETIAKSKNLPNAFDANMDIKDVWECLSNMFEVLNHTNNKAKKQEVKPSNKPEVNKNETATENIVEEQ